MKTFVRTSAHESVRAAAETLPRDVTNGDPGQLAREAVLLPQLTAIQVAHDQFVTRATDHANGVFQDIPEGYDRHAADVLRHCRHYEAVLKTAYDAAHAMNEHVAKIVNETSKGRKSMSANDPTKPPQLTTTGEPHPLTEGGYQPEKDTQKPSNVSDVAALKEGKATHAMNEAVAKADAADAKDKPKPGPDPNKVDAVVTQKEHQAAAGQGQPVTPPPAKPVPPTPPAATKPGTPPAR